MARPKRFKVTSPDMEKSSSTTNTLRPKSLKVGQPQAGSVSSTHSESHSRPSSSASGPVTMPPTHELENSYSSDSDSSDDDVLPTSRETALSSSKKKSYWIVSLIDEDGTITEGKLKVRDVWSLPTGKKIIIPYNEYSQPIDDAGGLLGGFLGDLGSDYSKLPMCYKSWRKVPIDYKNNVFDDIIQKKFLVDDGRLKENIMQSIGKKWKDTRCSLYHRFHKASLTLEENVARRPSGIDPEQWMWFLQYRKDKRTQKICKQNAENRRKQEYTHCCGSKSLSRRKAEEERRRGGPLSRGELWTLTHKRKDKSYMNEAAKRVGEEIEKIESQSGSSKQISEVDSLAQVLGKEHSSRVRGVGYGVTPTQVFGQTGHKSNGLSSVQHSRDHKMEEMKLKMQQLESVVESERSRRRALENFLTRFLVQQGVELPAELADTVNVTASVEGREPISSSRPSSSSKC